MSTEHPATKPGLKQKAKHELVDFAWIAFYLAFFFCALVTYTMLVLRNYDVSDSSMNYTFALVNALVIGKVILIGEMARLGRGAESRPLYQGALYKAIVYSLLVLAFHFLEEFIRRIIQGKPFGTVWHNIHSEELIARSIVVFCAFLPLFAFRELRRVLGEQKLYALFFKSRVEKVNGSSPGEGAQ
ncbi:hypothetical protein [Tunturiibacter gelidoferens]|uniref:Uncharacterized protein n=2 Tax=Tunturiibacter gelidiferens TaxID=3069689 RepID=A0AAU7Z4M4_9BACT|nr:hypothetical protein [Edaphobacter lichenicola]MBB5340121.1 hypothetical protein [Edaphobacter lichenicola]